MHAPDAGARDPIDVSVIVPFRDAERYLPRCIEALVDQSYPAARREILMVDNGSTDRSAGLVGGHQDIQLLAEPRRGSYAARNRGVAASRGRILAFTDADCAPRRDWLDAIVAAFAAPELDVALGRRRYVGESSRLKLLETYEAERAARVFGWKSPLNYFGYTNNMAVRREAFERSGPFPELARGADTIFVRQVVRDRSPEAVRFVSGAEVSHLEMTGVGTWLRKKFVYGRTTQRHLELRRSYSMLSTAQGWSIIAGTLGKRAGSPLLAGHLVCLAGLGSLCFLAGRGSAAMEALLRGPASRDGRARS